MHGVASSGINCFGAVLPLQRRIRYLCLGIDCSLLLATTIYVFDGCESIDLPLCRKESIDLPLHRKVLAAFVSIIAVKILNLVQMDLKEFVSTFSDE